MKKIYFLILVFSAFLLSCGSKDSVTNAITETPINKTLTAVYDESNTSKSISVGDTLDAYTKNFELTYSDGTSSSSIPVDKDMITLDTTTVGEKVATISYNGLNATTSAIVCTSASAFTVSSNTITAYSGSETSVVIPRYIDSTEITTLGNVVFKGKTTLTSVIANNITTIANGTYDSGMNDYIGSFYDCNNLTSISLPEVTSIGENAFRDCDGLTSISLPKVTSIGMLAFCACNKLTSISLPEVTSIGMFAFNDCDGLTSISLPKVTSIGYGALADSDKLESIFIPSAISIGGYAISDCPNLKSVTLGTIPTDFGTYVFQSTVSNSTNLTIYVPKGTTENYNNLFTTTENTFRNRNYSIEEY